jgi:glycosyltransferase involved in cell wall biosynthesis
VKHKEKKLNISLIIPTYNDEKTIIQQVTRCEKILRKYCDKFEIIIADDYSHDKTRELLSKNFKNRREFKILFNKKNLGITDNVRQLYNLAKKDFVFFYSADGDWDTKDVEHLIKKCLEDNADIVIGKRKKKIGYTFYRHIISFFHKLLPLILFGVNTIDPGGIKLIRRTLAQIPLISRSQFFEAEIIIRAKKKGYRISSYPVVYKKIYFGAGYGGGFSSALHSVLDVLKLRFSII